MSGGTEGTEGGRAAGRRQSSGRRQSPRRRRERGRGERVIQGIWRLRLPLPWLGIVPHGNAFAVASGDGVVLFDTGIHEPESEEHPSSWSELELAMSQVGLRPSDVRLVVCTHAHADHYGQAGPIRDLTGCEVWLHPNHHHVTAGVTDPERAWERRLEVALQSGVPQETLRAYRESRRGATPGIAEVVEPDRELRDGVEVETDLGRWRVLETPGHAPSHVCLHQPEHGLLISGDHVLGRVSPYYEYGHTPDPAGEFLHSLSVVEAVGAGLCLAGHGRPFRDVQAHIDANRTEIKGRIAALSERLGTEPRTPFDLVAPDTPPQLAAWALTETLCYLTYLERRGQAVRHPGEPERWAAPTGPE